MSIGDSALDYLSEEEIRYKKNDAFHYINNKFLIIGIEDSSFTTYEIVQITLKPNDDSMDLISPISLLFRRLKI